MDNTTIKIDTIPYPGVESPLYRKYYYQLNKKVIAEKAKERYEANKEKILEKDKKYREANKEKILEKGKEYREANKEKIKEYREANKEKLKERYEEWGKQKVKCEHCGKELRKDGLKKHKETNYCLKRRTATVS